MIKVPSISDGLNENEDPFTSVAIQELSCFSPKIDPSHFQFLQILGQGSFGKVYLVRKRSGIDAGTLFAMKVLQKASLRMPDRVRTKLERDILAAINHPFIVQLQYAFQTEGKLYLILEYLRGGDLFSRLSREVRLKEVEAKFYLAELTLALSHLHRLGIIYRDLKPENILLDAEGHIKLTDFGLSKESVHKDSGRQTYSFCGTVEYMAPEVITRRGHDAAADWWSFGVLMFEMLTGFVPFQGETRRETMNLILKAKLLMPQHLSPEAQILLRALFKRNPQNRLGSGSNDLEDIKAQPFFVGMPWDRLLDLSYPPPYRPPCALDEDLGNLVTGLSPSPMKDSPDNQINSPTQDIFRGFSFVAPIDRTLSFKNSMSNQLSKSTVIISNEDNAVSSKTNTKSLTSPDKTSSKCTILNSRIKSKPGRTGLLSASQKNARPDTDRNSPSSMMIKGAKLTPFEIDYEIKDQLGYGSHSVCHRCINRLSKRICAVKIIDRSRHDPTQEVDILRRFNHLRNVVTLIDVYDSTMRTYLVMEYLPGGDLLDRLLEKKCLTEYESSRIMEVLVRTVAQFHDKSVVHRDLKPSNLVYASNDHDPDSIRICDFGFAKDLNSDSGAFLTPCYSSAYAAPEVLQDKVCETSCDLWSLGVILCIMLVRRVPYNQKPQDITSSMLGRIENENVCLSGPEWDSVSLSAKDLVSKLLHVDPKLRSTAVEVLNHPWIKNRQTVTPSKSARELNTLANEKSVNLVFNSLAIQPNVPTLEPVSASQLAARRQRSKTKIIFEKTNPILRSFDTAESRTIDYCKATSQIPESRVAHHALCRITTKPPITISTTAGTVPKTVAVDITSAPAKPWSAVSSPHNFFSTAHIKLAEFASSPITYSVSPSAVIPNSHVVV